MLQLKLPDTQEKIDLTQPRLAIGRDPSNDLVLEDDLISGFHATIFVDEGKVEIVDQGSSNGTFVNGQPITGRVALKAWDKIRLGNIEMEVIDSAARRPTVVQAAITPDMEAKEQASGEADGRAIGILRLLSSGSYPAQVDIRGNLTIGRNTSNNLCLESNTVSGNHARIEISGGNVEVIDLGSTNGTWVSGKRVERQRLAHGDRIRFDEVEYEIHLPGQEKDQNKTRVNPAISDATSATVIRPATELKESSESRSTAAQTTVMDSTAPPKETVVQAPPQMAAPSLGGVDTERKGFSGRGLRFYGSGLQALGWGLITGITCIFIIPAAWGMVLLYRWVVENMQFTDNTRAEFVGQPGQVWWIVSLAFFIGFFPGFINTGDDTVNFLIHYGLPFLFLPLTAYLWLLIWRWVFSSIKLSCGTKIHFNGQYGPFLGWWALNMIAPLTIIGWAWIHTAFFRWVCGHIEGGGQQVIFHGKGHDYLWRGLVAAMASIFIIPAPWMYVWVLRWFCEQIEVR